MRRGRWHRYPAGILLLCLLAAGCASQRAADPTATAPPAHDGLVGVRWQLTQVQSPGGTVAIPASLDSWFKSTSRYAVQGDDGCSFFDGTGHRSAQGFTVSDVITGANGCADVSGPLNAAINGFGHVLNGQNAQVRLSGTQLRLTAGKYTLVFASALHTS
jgi:heat shock protein HslJ